VGAIAHSISKKHPLFAAALQKTAGQRDLL